MKKRFKSYKYRRFKIRLLIFILLLIGSFYISFNYLYKHLKSNINKEDIIKYLIKGDSNSNINNIFKLNSTEFLLNYSLGITLDKEEEIDASFLGDYVEDPSPIKVEEPLIYIFNTHQSESYNKDIVTSYNISPTVMITSYMLREKLNDLGIPTIVETTNIKDVLNNNNWIYKDSYKASRILLERAYQNNSSLELFIDIHRDSSLYDKTTLEKDNKKYARVLFVVGLDYEGYESNLNNAIKLNEIINNELPGLSRGVLKKSGKGVNGIYNQNFHNNTFLIEVGGQYNSIDEVKNTIDVLSKAIFNYVKELTNEEKA